MSVLGVRAKSRQVLFLKIVARTKTSHPSSLLALLPASWSTHLKHPDLSRHGTLRVHATRRALEEERRQVGRTTSDGGSCSGRGGCVHEFAPFLGHLGAPHRALRAAQRMRDGERALILAVGADGCDGI